MFYRHIRFARCLIRILRFSHTPRPFPRRSRCLCRPRKSPCAGINGIEFEYSGPVKAPFGEETSIGFTATTKVRLLDFDLKWNEKMPGGGFVVGPEASVTLDVEADLVEE